MLAMRRICAINAFSEITTATTISEVYLLMLLPVAGTQTILVARERSLLFTSAEAELAGSVHWPDDHHPWLTIRSGNQPRDYIRLPRLK